jgi:hypothetical protein
MTKAFLRLYVAIYPRKEAGIFMRGMNKHFSVKASSV